MVASTSTPVPWRVDGPTTLHGFDDDFVYMLICTDTDDPELQRQVALVSAWDLDGEGYARMIAAVPKLLVACQAVVANWEHGDLAQAARLCQDALQTAMPNTPAAEDQRAAPSSNVRSVEYYRLWPGNSGDGGTWDTDFIDVPASTPDHLLDEALRQAAQKIKWREEPPVIVGCYCDASDEEDDDIPQQIRAECHSADRVYAAEFDALAWFEQAEDSDILKLAEEDWCDGYAADDVGIFMADLVPDVQKMFDYLEHYNQAHKEHIGWVCTVNKGDALAWLREHRSQVHSLLR